VIPTLNEEASLGPLIQDLKSKGFGKIIVVDGYSSDKTVEVASKFGAEVIMQYGKGKAGGLQTAFQVVSSPYLVVMDGDGSYDPSDLSKFLPLIGTYDFVKGVRSRNESMSLLHKFGNRIITKTFDFLFGTSIGDVCSGMYMLRTEMVKHLHFERHPMTVEQEIAAEMVQASGLITTIPINYRRRFGGISKTNTWRQGFRDLLTNFNLARLYNPIMLFSAIAMLALIPAFGMLIYALGLYLLLNLYHSGYFIAGIALLVLGAQGFTVATIAAMLRRIERKLSSIQPLS
jgi:dolichol-phosphate mannosyltransferase